MTDERRALADRLEALPRGWRSTHTYGAEGQGFFMCAEALERILPAILAALRQPSADGAETLGPNIYELVGTEIERHENWEAEVPLETIYKHNEDMTDAILEALSDAGYLSCAAMRSIKNGASRHQSASRQTPYMDDAFRRGAEAMREVAARHYEERARNLDPSTTGLAPETKEAFRADMRAQQAIATSIRALPIPEPKP